MTHAEDTAADTVAGIALAVPGVAALHPGMFGEVGTYLPGRRVTGVRVGEDRIEVHITVTAGAPIRQTAAQVRSAVGAALPGLPVDVTVEEVTTPPPATGGDAELQEDRL
ncbi:Asp23/Gls24 family envelope stress response protein [Mycobacterium sp. M26]|uniref:Asp23/Gls24 family envelope stress response protein n=1 Tax=Mycobacterium sp. M26 TaxID=1762962 RepID=UPI00073EDDE0|nr:Asp23/Gls24 family envelope stress response protein [Mycobacterium sp. M26]